MDWRDIACIVFVCVTVNHLGLIAAIKAVTKRNRLWVLDCPKCLTFWATLAYQTATVSCGSPQGLIAALPTLLAISLLASYAAIWLELIEGIIDLIYIKVYGKIYPTADTTGTDAERA